MATEYSFAQLKQPLYMQIYSELLEQINNGVFPEGSKLPSEKEITLKYGVSRITSKKAMDTLAADGYISRTPGRGTFVIKQNSPSPAIADDSSTGSKLIGVIIEKFSPSFGGDLVLGIERECVRNGYTMALRCTYHDKAAEERAVADLLKLGVAGIIIMCVYDETYNPLVLKLSLKKFPVVLVDRELSGIPLPCVATNNLLAARTLTDSLFDSGHENLTFVVAARSFQTSTVEERSRGFMQSCMEHGKIVDRGNWITGLVNTDKELTFSEIAEVNKENIGSIKKYMLSHPEVTGYVAASYDMAFLVQLADRECRKEQGDMAGRRVVCFDAPEGLLMSEPLTHIRQNQSEIGKMAVRYLIKRMTGEELPRMTYVDFELINE